MLEKFTLSNPLKLADGRTIKEINLRRAKYRDLRQVQRQHVDPADQQVALFALTSEEKLTPEDFNDLDLEDFMKMNMFFRRIMGDPLATAGNGGAAGPLVPVSAQ